MLRWLPENISSFGGEIDSIMYLIYYLVGAWFIVVQGVFIYFIVRYRRRPGRAQASAVYEPGRSYKALAWVMVPAALVLVCDFAIDARGASAWRQIKQEIPPHDVLVRIEGRQFAWNFRHAGVDGLLDTPDDIVTNGQLHVPVDKVVKFELISKDVLHSFWAPNLRLKQDAVPGRMIPGWFKATKPGSYGIGCAELCGTGHGVMAATLVVHAGEEYETWVKKY